MAKFAIELPESYGVTSRDVGVDVPLGAFAPEIIAKLALHGLTQKVGDSAAGALASAGFEGRKFKDLDEAEKAKVAEFARSAMQGVVDALVKGEWTERREGGGAVDPVTARVRVLVGAWLRENAKDVWAKSFKGLDPADRGEAIDAFMGAQDEDTQDAFANEARAQLKAETAAKAKVAKLTVKIGV